MSGEDVIDLTEAPPAALPAMDSPPASAAAASATVDPSAPVRYFALHTLPIIRLSTRASCAFPLSYSGQITEERREGMQERRPKGTGEAHETRERDWNIVGAIEWGNRPPPAC